MFKIGDKVRFTGKTGGGYSVEEVEEEIGLYLTRDCFGVIIFCWESDCKVYLYSTHTKEKIGDAEWMFNKRDLIPFEDINYNSLSEIEE